MTDPLYTHISMLVDRSQSMTKIRHEAEDGVNRFIADQANTTTQIPGGRATLTLAQFDNLYDMVYDTLPIGVAGLPSRFRLVPRGNTALLDSMTKLIRSTGQRLAQQPETYRPGVVLFVVQTDGEENCSFQATNESVRALVTEHSEVYKWQFIYLGANQDSFAVARELGINANSTIDFYATAASTQNVYNSLSANTTGLRTAAAAGTQSQFIYSNDDRNAAKEK